MFRSTHKKLSEVIQRVLVGGGDEAGGGEDAAGTGVDGEGAASSGGGALHEVVEAYKLFLDVDVLDVSPEGTDAWEAAQKAYDRRIDRVEGRIIERLTDRLGAAKQVWARLPA